MGKDIAPFVHCAFFGGNQNRPVFTVNGFSLKTLYFQITFGNLGRNFYIQQRRMAHRRQRFFFNLFPKRLHFAPERRHIANQAQTGRNHQKHHDNDKPCRSIDVIQSQKTKNLRPKRSEFDQIIRLRLVLLQHRTDNRCNTQQTEQSDCKAHGAEKSEPRTGKKWGRSTGFTHCVFIPPSGIWESRIGQTENNVPILLS